MVRAEALDLAQEEKADWADENKLALHFRAPIIVPRGKLNIWVPKQSGFAGPLVLQYQ